MVVVAMAATIVACSSDDPKQDYNPLIDDPQQEEPQTTDEPTTQGGYHEQYRPQIHFTPAKNWINDPNGMVFVPSGKNETTKGTYHLFYQYNPQGNDWGNMSWGHATSSDLIHWTEQAVALTRDELGAVFSGSCVIADLEGASTGAQEEGTMVAFYTAAGEKGDVQGKQQQCMAYSTDGGKNFTRYAGNPIIKNDDDNLRDPKVFWHEASHKWVMALAKGWKMGVEFYGSTDLKSWQHLSTFFMPLPGRPNFQWECPDLFIVPLSIPEQSSPTRSLSLGGEAIASKTNEAPSGTVGGTKWVLLVSVNPGGPLMGSGTMYFVGNFDGTTFTADERDYPLWLDYGMDNYAGVTWSNTGDRHIMIGWMNNWSYSGNVPCSPWRSAMTLPRELKLVEYDGKPLLASTVVSEIDNIAESWQPLTSSMQSLTAVDAYQLRIKLSLDRNTTVTLSNGADEKFVFDINGAGRALTAHRTSATGQTNFNGTFSIPSMRAPLNTDGNSVTLDVFVDQSSVEIFTENGSMAMTNLVFPKSIYNQISVDGGDYEAQVRKLKSIW